MYKEENFMKKKNLFLSIASKFALPTFVVLVVLSLGAWFAIRTTPAIYGKWPGYFATLFDYSRYAVDHPARLTGQILSNLVAYAFMLAAVVLTVLSLVLIKHDKLLKLKAACISLLVLFPVTFGLAGGFINFVGEGLWTCVRSGSKGALSAFLLMFVYLFDFLYLAMAVIYLVYAIKTAVKVNKGELQPEEEEEAAVGEKQESAEDKAKREEERAERRASLLREIRKIVREELDKLDRVAIVTGTVPADEEGEEDEEGNPKNPRAPRVPFAKKIVAADKDIQDKYNEIKNEIMAYGASTRLSVGGDTFRLHRKPYVKITLVGKSLKLYFALDPKDFVDSPIPVIDASDKNAYAEVPALLKVKSNLSVKRAKDLAAMAFAKDGVEKEQEAGNHDYVKDIRAELKAQKK